MTSVGGGTGDEPDTDPSADWDDLVTGDGDKVVATRRSLHRRVGRRLRPTKAGWTGIGAAALALLVGFGVGGLVFGGREPAVVAAVSAPEPAPTVTVTAEPEPTATGPAPEPTRLVIPSLDLDEGLIDLFVSQDGTMGVPSTPEQIGWWEDGPAPGDSGGALIAAHVSLGGQPGAFSDLGTMEDGQTVVVERADGSSATFEVSSVEQYAKDDFPDDRVYTYEGPNRLHLVTCGGAIDEETGHYLDNIVVFADLVSDTRAPTDA